MPAEAPPGHGYRNDDHDLPEAEFQHIGDKPHAIAIGVVMAGVPCIVSPFG